MSPDILQLHPFRETERGQVLALPVLAVECAVSTVQDQQMDPYEDAVLRLISLSCSAGSIAHTLCARKSLIEEVLGNLADKGLALRKSGSPWQLTQDGEAILRGEARESRSDKEQYGFFFVSTLRKEVLPYFWKGDLRKIPCYGGPVEKLTGEDGEEAALQPFSLPPSQYREAYRHYQKLLRLHERVKQGEESQEEALSECWEIPTFDELPPEPCPQDEQSFWENENTTIRPLDLPPRACYLCFQLLWDAAVPEGYRVLSPLPLWGLDSVFFLRHVQWLMEGNHAWLKGKSLGELMDLKLQALQPTTEKNSLSFPQFLRKKLPRLLQQKERYPHIYRDLQAVYGMMQRESGLVEQESIVGALARKVAEPLFNRFFAQLREKDLCLVQEQALEDLDALGAEGFLECLEQRSRLSLPRSRWTEDALRETLRRLSRSHGNSLPEKLLNLAALHHYLPTEAIVLLLERKDVQELYEGATRLNKIRNKVSHDTEIPFEAADYSAYLQDFYPLMDRLLGVDQEKDYG